MGSGYGWVQQEIVDLFARGDVKYSTEEVAATVFHGTSVSPAMLSSTRRALSSLAKAGVIFDRGRRFMAREKRWSSREIEVFSQEWN